MFSMWGWIETYEIPSGNLLQLAMENGPFIVGLSIEDGDFP